MRQLMRNTRTVAAFSVVYFITDVALNRLFTDGWAIIWPLNGINVAILLMRPRSQWFYILLGIEIGTGTGECLDDNTIPLELCQRLLSVTEVVLSAALLPPFSTLEQWLRTPRLFARFLLALTVGPVVSGLLAAVLFYFVKHEPFLVGFDNWAAADALGMATTMPLALAVGSPQMRGLFERPARLNTLGALSLTFLGAALIFSVSRYPLVFLLYPLLLLVDSLLAFAGSAIAAVGVLLISMYFTTRSWGPFGHWPPDLAVSRNLALQLYFGFHVIALFPASIMFMERRRLGEELRVTNARLTVLAALDGLTGIPNRRSFDERFAVEWTRAARLHTPLALALIDLDNFKQYNDIYGHVVGDQCLCAVAAALAQQTQRAGDFVARYGGEEFVLLLPDTNADGVAIAVERIRTAVHDLGIDHLGNSWNRVTVSIGYATSTPTQADARPSLVQLADAALYKAKSGGRNRVELLTSIEGLQAANDHSATAKMRLLRILGRNER